MAKTHLTNISLGQTAFPASVSYSIVAGTTNVALITITAKDGDGAAMSRPTPLKIWLSDTATGLGVTGTTASGTVAVSTYGTDLADLIIKKVKEVITDDNGVYRLAITDTAKTGFYVASSVPGTGKISVSQQLVSSNYG